MSSRCPNKPDDPPRWSRARPPPFVPGTGRITRLAPRVCAPWPDRQRVRRALSRSPPAPPAPLRPSDERGRPPSRPGVPPAGGGPSAPRRAGHGPSPPRRAGGGPSPPRRAGGRPSPPRRVRGGPLPPRRAGGPCLHAGAEAAPRLHAGAEAAPWLHAGPAAAPRLNVGKDLIYKSN